MFEQQLSLLRELPLKRIIIVGFPGSGKSTSGRLLASELQIPFLSADAYFWKSDGTSLDPHDFKVKVHQVITENKEWIFEGHFKTLSGLLLKEATAVVEIDTGFWTSYYSYVSRELRSRESFLKRLQKIAYVFKNRRSIIEIRKKAMSEFKGLRLILP